MRERKEKERKKGRREKASTQFLLTFSYDKADEGIVNFLTQTISQVEDAAPSLNLQ